MSTCVGNGVCFSLLFPILNNRMFPPGISNAVLNDVYRQGVPIVKDLFNEDGSFMSFTQVKLQHFITVFLDHFGTFLEIEITFSKQVEQVFKPIGFFSQQIFKFLSFRQIANVFMHFCRRLTAIFYSSKIK